MSFEKNFPDEIILEICRYLNPTDILLSFGGLNYRLNRTISDFIQHIYLSSIISYENYLYLLKIIFPTIWSSIQSLTINNDHIPCLTALFLEYTERILPANLKTLHLFHLNTNEIYNFINRLMNKCVVEELIIECIDTDYVKQQNLYGYKIAQMLFFHHPTLKSIELRGEITFDVNHLSFLPLLYSQNLNSINISDMSRLSILRRLTVQLQSLSCLHLLLMYQPYLEYLNIFIGEAKSTCDYTITPFPPLLNLFEFHFGSEDLEIKFENLLELLTYFPNLKSLSLDLTTECRSFFDGDILQTLVYNLDTFQYSITRLSRPTSEEQTLSTFYTSFWLEIKKWYTQSYWNIDQEDSDLDYFHIYSVPYPLSNFHIERCTNENLVTKDKFKKFLNVKQLDVSVTSDINIIPFLKCCPNIHTISLSDIYDDEENYGTDEEEDIMDETDEINDCQTINSSQSSLPILSHVRYLILLLGPKHNFEFFERFIRATPNLNRISLYINDLLEIINVPQYDLCQLLQKYIHQLEIHLDYPWTLLYIRRDIPKILRTFSNIKSLTILLSSTQKNILITIKGLLTYLFKYETNFICINIESNLLTSFEDILKQGGIQLIKSWLTTSNDIRFKNLDYLNNSIHIDLNFSSLTIWL